MYLVDTNILLKYPSVLTTFQGEIVLSIRVLEELDGLKRNHNPEVAYEARRASHKIFAQIDDIVFEISDRFDELKVDDALIALAAIRGYEMISNDLNIHIKAVAEEVICHQYDKVETNYTGVEYLRASFDDTLYNEEIDKMLDTGEAPIPMRENEFLIVKNKETGESYCDFVYRKGKLNPILKDKCIRNQYIRKISPKNMEQDCLFNLLFDRKVSIVAATGEFGTGKSFILTNFALQELEEGRINKIVYVPNNSIVENTRELGVLPGDTIDKELCYMGPILDLIGEDHARRMVEEGLIEIVPISVMRGRSFPDSIIIVNEAQNLTDEHIKLLVARCGEGTRIFFDGDIKQTDSYVFKNKNGLKLLLHLSESEDFAPIFGTIRLNSIERSKTAQASAYLDNLLI